ncbi:hypothetical protein DC498_24585 [Terrimonas sp.]|uniref:hybrid sensor histidine kinase/response regulator transcription factor n=1 Tax=Terrimonas sp. TaxID=1914338 RepID=UPI000D5207D5|nr:ATP-binding protein [Terrimonas sp.]PVD49506.1 hypothetical protein DC498_24585 [Terrimonas sp.]
MIIIERYILVGLLIFFLALTELSWGNTQVIYSFETANKADTASVDTLIQLAESYLRTDIKLADSLAKEAYNLLPKSGYNEILANCLLLMSYTSSTNGAHAEGFEYCRKAISISETIKDKQLISRSYNQLYLLHYQKGNYDSATLAAEQSLTIAKEINFQTMLARGHQNFGILNSIKGRYAAAIENFLISEQYYTELQDDLALAMLLGNLGVTFEEMGNRDKALEYMHQELNLSTKIKNENLQAWSMVNLGSVHSQSGRSDSALHYYDQSLEIARRINNHDLIITNLDNIGSYYSGQKAYEKATIFLKEAFALAEEMGYSYQNVYTSGHMAENYLSQKKFDSASYYAKKQLNLAIDNELLYDQKLAYSILSRIYSAQQDYAKAYDALVSHTAIKDSLFNAEKSKQAEELRERYEAEKKDNTIILLREQQEAATFRRRAYVLAGTLIAAVLLPLYFRERTIGRKNLRLLEKEKELEQMKSRFFSNISHEFRTPLTLILGPIETIHASTSDLQMIKQLGMVERSARRLLGLVDQLLYSSKLESGNLEMSITTLDIVSLVRGVTTNFSSMAADKQINLSIDSAIQHLVIPVDREKIETVMINLLSNAFKFTNENGKITVSIRLVEREGISWCDIQVQDTGIGIDEKDIPHIFNRFYQGAEAQKSHYAGSGIGLALSKELVRLHNGDIAAFSKPGEGTEIVVSLPLPENHEMLQPAQQITPGFDEVQAVLPGNSLSDETKEKAPLILVIEDNKDVMLYVKDILHHKYTIAEATNGADGIKTANEIIPDLIISDVVMPEKNGYEVCEALKKDARTSHIPLILLTAKASVEDKIMGLQQKADEYLIKPFSPKELLLRISNLLESRKLLQEKYRKELILKPKDIVIPSMEEVFLQRIMQVVEEQMSDENLSVVHLAKEAGMSRSQLHRKLNALTNQSPTAFIRSYRLNKAMEMIRQNAGTIAEISYKVGFSSPSYFSKVFLQQYGITPAQAKAGDT